MCGDQPRNTRWIGSPRRGDIGQLLHHVSRPQDQIGYRPVEKIRFDINHSDLTLLLAKKLAKIAFLVKLDPSRSDVEGTLITSGLIRLIHPHTDNTGNKLTEVKTTKGAAIISAMIGFGEDLKVFKRHS